MIIRHQSTRGTTKYQSVSGSVFLDTDYKHNTYESTYTSNKPTTMTTCDSYFIGSKENQYLKD